MQIKRLVTLRNWLHDELRIEFSNEDLQGVLNNPIISPESLAQLAYFCSISLTAATLAQRKAKLYISLLKDCEFKSLVLNLVSSICINFPSVITLDFMKLVTVCFQMDEREEYAYVLPISAVFQFDISKLDDDEICNIFQIVVQKMDYFEPKVLDIICQRLFLSRFSINSVIAPEIIVLIANLYNKFPYEMFTYDNLTELLLESLECSGENQQQELCFIFTVLIYEHLLSDSFLEDILGILGRRKHLFNSHISLVEKICLIIKPTPRILEQLKVQALVLGNTQKHSQHVIKSIGIEKLL